MAAVRARATIVRRRPPERWPRRKMMAPMMKKTIHRITLRCALFWAVCLAAAVPATASSLRCGNDLIMVGDAAYLVERKIEKCGRILQRTVVGERKMREFIPFGPPFAEEGRRYGRWSTRTVVIETWFVLIDSYTDYCYALTFEGGTLVDIGDFKKCE